ncbi:prevent-host-death family protein [Enterococcus faecalis 13-SD-W-01]|nr:prevent-host-death family protein [Enterococcus faecalis 13-SD-W-01]
METVTYSEFRKNFRSYIKRVSEDAETLFIKSEEGEKTVVLLPKREYDSMEEKLRMLSNN